MTRARIVLSSLAALVLLGVLAVVIFFEAIVLAVMTPDAPFDPSAAPRPPDYADPAAWSALPEREDAADAVVPGEPATDPKAAPADVFYVHPTTHIGASWNAPVDDPGLNADTDRVATRLQASAFNGCCAVYAPRYRQANGTAFTHPSADGRRALDLAYQDVSAAFQHYLTRSGGGRPFILAAHSQGTVLAERLLREMPAEVRARLVVAYLIGVPIAALPEVPACGSPEQTGCMVGWNARGPEFRPGGTFEIRGLGAGEPLCVNPLTWTRDGAPAPAALNEGALFLESDAPAVLPGFASARCVGGTLVVAEIGAPPRDFMSRLLDYSLGPGNYHPIEYQLFFMNLRRNAQVRVAAWSQRRG